MSASDAQTHTAAQFTRPLFLAKISPTDLLATVSEPDSSGDLVASHIAAIAAPDVASPDAEEVTRAMLTVALAQTQTPDTLIAKAAAILRRNLGFDFAGAYLVEESHADRLTLVASEGLVDEFSETARTLPLWDFGDIADMPYNGDRPPCYGDFFAPVAAAFGVRAWLVASLADPLTAAVRGALLFGSRDARRLDASEAAAVLSLAATVSTELASRFPAA